jgi:hypothetical protein
MNIVMAMSVSGSPDLNVGHISNAGLWCKLYSKFDSSAGKE